MVCLNIEWAIVIWHSWLKHLNCWWKPVKNLICYRCIFNMHRHVYWKSEFLKFKLLYVKNYISYFNKICGICCVNTRIQSLKVWLQSVLLWLEYRIFSRGLFFIGALCMFTMGWRFRHSGDQFLPRDAMLSVVYAVIVCLSVCLCVCVSVTLRYCIKTAKRWITQLMPHDSPLTLVFWHRSSLRNSNGITPYGGDKCRWGGLKFVTFDEKRAIARKRYKIDA